MFSKIKSLFGQSHNPEDLPADFKHPNMEGADPAQCPFSKKNQSGDASKEKSKPEKNSDDESEEEEQKPRGGCPFMASSGTKKNPSLGLNQEGYDEPFVSKFKYYLSANKINMHAIRKGKTYNSHQREVFNTYPIYLQHTLFANGEDYQKVRTFECCSRFLAYQELRERGNKFFNKGKYARALDFYERAMSLFRWLEHKEPEPIVTSTQLELSEIRSKSQFSDEQQMGSKVHLNLEQNPRGPHKEIEEREKQFDELTSKYKEFFVIYNDTNVQYFDGEDFTEKSDIDMKNSLLIQVYLNMAAAYIKLNNFSLARQIVEDGFRLSQNVSQLYLRKAQAILCDKKSDLESLNQAKQSIQKAISMRSEQKIFQGTNQNILKMINIHDAEEVYNQTLKQIEEKIVIVSDRYKERKEAIENRLIFINKTQQQILSEGKVPRESSTHVLMSETSQYKILQRMHDKYVRVLQFYTEAKNKEQIMLAKKEMQEVLRVLSQIHEIEMIKIEKDEERFGPDAEKVINRIKNIKKQNSEEIYNYAKYNFHVLEWAIKEIVKEEKEEQEAREKQEKELLETNKSQTVQVQKPFLSGKQNIMNKMPYIMVLLPALGFVVNQFLF